MLFLTSLLLLFTSVLGQLPVQHLAYQAFIKQHGSENQCGATLIAPEWLLTADYCLRHRDIREAPVDVFLGVSWLEQIDDDTPKWPTGSMVHRRVARYFLGPRVEIGNRTQESGLMLLKLDRRVTTSGKVKPIDLPEVGTRWMVNQTAVVSGFQHRSMDRDSSLQHLKGFIMSKSRCLSIYRHDEMLEEEEYQKIRPLLSPESVLCAGIPEGSHNVCLGVYGGPLAVCATPLRETSGQMICKHNRWLLAGVATGGASIGKDGNYCADLESPAFYANVPVFAEWIRRVIRNN